MSGVSDMVGNGWEWTSSLLEAHDGFVDMKNYPGYSSDFFDGQHYVLKGASPYTSSHIIRPSFRNFYQPNYGYMLAKFRVCW